MLANDKNFKKINTKILATKTPPPRKTSCSKGLRIFDSAMSSDSEQARNVLCRTKGDLMSRFVKGKNHTFATSRIIRHGFTLAEVLITLAIIGVVAVLTIPNLISKYQEQATISQVKKFYSNLNNALKLAINENGTLDTWNIQTPDDFIKPIIKNLKVQKDCGRKLNSGCIPNEVYYLSGTYYGQYDISGAYYKFILENSATVWARKDGSCTGDSTCGIMWYDTNGKKKPNTLGKDIFHFYIYRNKVVPCCAPSKTDCHKKDKGWGCAKYIMLYGNMDYLH